MNEAGCIMKIDHDERKKNHISQHKLLYNYVLLNNVLLNWSISHENNQLLAI